MRQQTEPGGWQRSPGSVTLCACGSGIAGQYGGDHAPGCRARLEPDEVPTRPDSVDPTTLALVRVIGDMTPAERERAVKLLTGWHKTTLDRQVLIEAFVRELSP